MINHRPVLLVEDNEIDQEAVQRSFSKLKIPNPLRIVNNGEEGIVHLRENEDEPPLFILLDLNMPRMNGIEFLKTIKSDERTRRIPTVVFTTSIEDNDMLRSYDLGVAGYIQKPTCPSEVTELIRTVDAYWSTNEVP